MAAISEIVREGKNVRLCWPTESELEAIADLLVRPSVRRYALDDPPIDRLEIWTVHRFRLAHPYAALLSIRWSADDTPLGVIGWYGLDPEARTVWIGHLAVDPSALRRVARRGPREPIGPALDAGRALCDHLFEDWNAETLLTYHVVGNAGSETVQRAAGFLETSREVHERPDGSRVEMIYNTLARERWHALRALERGHEGAPEAMR